MRQSRPTRPPTSRIFSGIAQEEGDYTYGHFGFEYKLQAQDILEMERRTRGWDRG